MAMTRMQKRLTGIFAAAAIATGVVAISSIHNNNKETPIDAPKTPGHVLSAAETAPLTNAKEELSVIFDNEIRIGYAGGVITYAPIYGQLQALAVDVGAADSYETFRMRMQSFWIGLNPGQGGVTLNGGNPSGKLQGLFVNARLSPMSDMEGNLRNFIDILKSKPRYTAKIDDHKEAQAFINSMPEKTNLLFKARNVGVPSPISKVKAFEAEPKTKALAKFLPNEKGEQSLEFRVLRLVAEKIKDLSDNPHPLGSAEYLARQMLEGLSGTTVIREACTMTRAWDSTYAVMRAMQEFPASIQAARAAMPGVDIQDVLDKTQRVIHETGAKMGPSALACASKNVP